MMSHSGNPKLSLILPCFNEMQHIEKSLRNISEFLDFVFSSEGYEIILVDDGSTDGTRNYLRMIEGKHRVFLNEKNLGRGGAVKRGLQVARGKICGFMDIDCEVAEFYIPKFVQQIEDGQDLVIGSRYYNVDLTPKSLSRHIASTAYRKIVQWFFGGSTVDSESGYKFFSQAAKEVILDYSKFDNWFWDTESVFICQTFNLKVLEVPVLFLRNRGKTSTVHLFRDSLQYLKSIREYRALASNGAYQPKLLEPKRAASDF